MRVVSLNVGLPREVEWHGRAVLTSIFKFPVNRRLWTTTVNFEGDEQSDLTVHGGVEKAVHVNLYTVDEDNRELLRRATRSSILPESWKDHFRNRLWEADAGSSG